MRKLATVREIKDIKSIDGADNIELALVDGWQSIVKKGEFKTGDLCVYFEIDSFLPVRPEFEFLRKSSFKTLEGKEGFRLKTIWLRGQLSQGLIMPIEILPVGENPTEGMDVTEYLNVTKYEKPIPTQLSGKIRGDFPTFVPKTDAERIQNCFDSLPGGWSWNVSEKVDGSPCTVYNWEGRLGVCSRNFDLDETDDNTFWRTVRDQELHPPEGYAIQGELLGPKIQGNLYNLSKPKILIFSVWNIVDQRYLDYPDFELFCAEHGFETVPQLGSINLLSTVEENLLLAEGKSMLNDTEREGLVWRFGRLIFKTISNKWLLNEKD